MNVTRATQTAAAAPERPGTFADGQTRHSGPQGPRTGQRRATATRDGQAGSPQRPADAPDGTGVPPGAPRPSVASTAGRAGPSRTSANTRPDPRSIPPHLRALLPLLAGGHARYRIAHLLGVRRSTLDPRLNRLYRLLGAHDRHSAVTVARQIGLLPADPKETTREL